MSQIQEDTVENVEQDPLFKIKQIFGSVEEFKKAIRETGGNEFSILKNITYEVVTVLPQYKTFASQNGGHIDNISAERVVNILRSAYKHYLDTNHR
jgi:hypothetical protein